MKKLVCLLVVAFLAAGAYAGGITIIPNHPEPMTAPGGYVWDPPRIGNESRNITWSSTEHRDIAQIFTPNVDVTMSNFFYRLDTRGGEYAIYIPAYREISVSLYQLVGGGDYYLNHGTVVWSGTLGLTSALNNPAPNSIIMFSFDYSYQLMAGQSYAIRFDMADMQGTDKYGSGYLSYGIFGPEESASPGNHVVGELLTGRYAITPEPATIALLSLGGLLLRRRK